MLGVIGHGAASVAWRQARGAANLARSAAVSPTAATERKPAAVTAAAGGAAAAAAPFGPSEMPYVPNGYGPTELATRTRVRFPDLGAQPFDGGEENGATEPQGLLKDAEGEAKQALLPGMKDEEPEWENLPGMSDDENGEGKVADTEKSKSAADEMQEAKCETCEKRKYQDGSDDPGVSFKNPTRVDPRMAQAAVRGHEMEHVVRERAKAQQEGRRVVSQTVTYHTGICPECGKMYVSGGTTRTVTAADNSKDILETLKTGGKGLDITA